MSVPENLRYTKEHEWVKIDGEEALVGITHHAQDALGDIVYVEFPEVGESFACGDVFGVVESVKTTSDLYTPLSGEVVAVNEALVDGPEKVNESPYGDGWMVKIKLANLTEVDGLMDAASYRTLLKESADH